MFVEGSENRIVELEEVKIIFFVCCKKVEKMKNKVGLK